MTIHLNIKMEDHKVEEVLTLLQHAYPEASAVELYGLLNNVLDWLRPVMDFRYRIDPSAGDEVSLDFGHTDPVSSPHPDTPSQ